jgi:dienelactone hydrolase
MAYQFRRALGETQEGGGAVSECFQAASQMVPGDKESWHVEWKRVADRNRTRAQEAEAAGHIATAVNCWLRAVDYYRSAEFWLAADDPRRLETFGLCEQSFVSASRYFTPPAEVVRVPCDGSTLHGYFLRSPHADGLAPVLISFGGLDSFKEECFFMTGRGALARGISCLLMDGPGQGATLRREGLNTRFDYEVPVGACIDYLETRDDVDTSRIAVSGTSLGGYYAARAGCFEHRLAAVISHGAIWDVHALFTSLFGPEEDPPMATHLKWVFGCESIAEVLERARAMTLEGCIGQMECPYLIVHGGYDVLGVKQASQVEEGARRAGVDVVLRVLTPEETGSDHCQHDNPTIGQEVINDWLVDRFGIDERSLRG